MFRKAEKEKDPLPLSTLQRSKLQVCKSPYTLKIILKNHGSVFDSIEKKPDPYPTVKEKLDPDQKKNNPDPTITP